MDYVFAIVLFLLYHSVTYGLCYYPYKGGSEVRLPSYKPESYGYNSSYHGTIPVSGILNAISYAADYEHRIFGDDKGLGRNEDDPSYWGNGIATEEYVVDPKGLADIGYFLTKVTEYLQREYGYNPAAVFSDGLKLNNYLEYLPARLRRTCSEFYKKCRQSKYRSLDGSCNNFKFPFYGKSDTILGRIAIPRYVDGIYEVPKSIDGSHLPPPRSIRYRSLPDRDVEEPLWNMFFVNFGQFITHDLVHTAFYQGDDGLFLDCCSGYHGSYAQVHPKCLAIPIQGDPFYGQRTHETCLNFARAIVAPNYGCAVGYANPLNHQTAYLDLSLQYGRNLKESVGLRQGYGGLLTTSHVGDQVYLPQDPNAECFNSSQKFCFKSGDLRTTIQPGMIVLQTLSTRFHNYLAKGLSRLNPSWDDEKLYQEARRINIAVNQHIVYSEYLPILLGKETLTRYGILPPSYGYSHDYDDKAKSWIYAEFSGSAFRLHTTVYGKLLLADEEYNVEHSLPLEEFYNSAILFKEPRNFGKLLRGYLLVPHRKHDRYYDPAISDYLFKDKRHFGLDIGAFNIQRGRDYGLASYNDYRQICGLPKAISFNDFHDFIDAQTVEEFKKLYKYPDDVDLYAGGIAERPLPGSLLGPTHSCIVAYQFLRLKVSDRYFYTHDNQAGSFTPAQLAEIGKITLRSYLCMTSDLTYVPAAPFNTFSYQNHLISCSDHERIPKINLLPWQTGPSRYDL